MKIVLFSAAGENGLPGVSAEMYQGTLEDDSWGSGVGIQRIQGLLHNN